MFEVGKYYQFMMIDGGEQTTFSGVVEKYEHPLIKLRDEQIPKIYSPGNSPAEEDDLPGMVIKGKIINVTTPNFISAEEQDQK